MMKVLYVLHSFPPFHWRGTEVYGMELSSAMRAFHEVHVFHLVEAEEEKVRMERENTNGITVHRARMKIEPGNPSRYFFPEDQEKAFRELLSGERFQVVHFLYFTGGLSLNLPIKAAEAGARVFITVTDFSGFCPRGQLLDGQGARCPGPREGLRCVPCLFGEPLLFSSPRADRFAREFAPPSFARKRNPKAALIFRRLSAARAGFHRSELVIYPNPHTRKIHRAMGFRARKEKVMDYGIELSRFRDHRKSKSDRVRIGFIGQMLPHKGLHVLAEALSGFSGNWKLIIHGSLEDPGAREFYNSLRLDPERTDFRGTFPFPEMNQVLEEIDILVVPSLWDENCPLLVKYGLATNTALVLADQPGIVADRARLSRTWFFKPGDARDLRKALEQAIKEAEKNQSGEKGSPRPEQKPPLIDINEQAAELARLYEKSG